MNITSMETRVALFEDGDAVEIHVERPQARGIVGNIYSGKVVRVLPGMQSAFIDIGVERTGFVHVADIVAVDASGRETTGPRSENISDYLREGQGVVVQVTKDPMGSKGARLTTQLSIATRFLVFLPQTDHIGISQLIRESAERARLQQIVSEGLPAAGMTGAGGFILRTAAEGASAAEIEADLRFLQRLWAQVSQRMGSARRPQLLHRELPLHLRALRDLVRPSVTRVLVDCAESHAAMAQFCREFVPQSAGQLEHYQGDAPLFDLYQVEQEIQQALERRVDLQSGGYLVIDQTEAMTTIDVNTGSFVGRRDQAATILKTNLEAATALARQLRLRNLGGIIIVDFIDMENAEHRRQVQQALEQAMESDPVRNHIAGISELGLVAMTRKRSRESLAHTLCEPCPVCTGRGVLKTAETVCREIFREISRNARVREHSGLMVLASQSVIDRLAQEESAHLADVEEITGKSLSCRVEPGYSQEHFDIILL